MSVFLGIPCLCVVTPTLAFEKCLATRKRISRSAQVDLDAGALIVVEESAFKTFFATKWIRTALFKLFLFLEFSPSWSKTDVVQSKFKLGQTVRFLSNQLLTHPYQSIVDFLMKWYICDPKIQLDPMEQSLQESSISNFSDPVPLLLRQHLNNISNRGNQAVSMTAQATSEDSDSNPRIEEHATGHTIA
jgi:hypothetical protein